MPDTLSRAALGLLAAVAIALVARRSGSLSTSGAVAASAVGMTAVAADWGWGALLVLYFVLSSLLSHAGSAEKARRTAGIVEKGGARDATQVLANGGVFALCCLGVLAADQSSARLFAAAAAGSLAAATADTWATEIGTLFGGVPRAALTFRAVPPGTSGALSAAGIVAMIAGALGIAIIARLLGLSDHFAAVTAAGCVGAMTDTLLGAVAQDRRWCDECSRATERRRHDCGTVTRHVGGMAAVDNDAVNLLATLAGAVSATLLAFVW
ncbi:MAG TPA: DUF92 domain-containing protein [Gemmatimonadaceae bacterium]|nr:DUF92 domain-containing protein [Gemmatimonadaceae bacterium]